LKSSEQKNWAIKPKLKVLFWAIPKSLSKFRKNPKYIKKVEKLKNNIFLSKIQQMTFKTSIT
jgi:hypothetical protein